MAIDRTTIAVTMDRCKHHFLVSFRAACLSAGVFLFALFLGGSQIAHAQGDSSSATDSIALHENQVVTVQRNDYAISGLVTHVREARTFKYAIALFPGYPGIMKLRDEAGQPAFELRGNFLVRSRRHWLDKETLVVVVDAPSDQWATFSQAFRESPRYGADVEALLNEIASRYGVNDWTFVGTSEGSVSALHAARMNSKLARRVVLTASLFRANRNGAGLFDVEWNDPKSAVLVVHHEGDPCKSTSYRDAVEFSKRIRKPLVTVRGGGPQRGDDCQAFTSHGFVGVERETVLAILSWVKSGVVPGDVGP